VIQAKFRLDGVRPEKADIEKARSSSDPDRNACALATNSATDCLRILIATIAH
jgi:hypothetical protein